jgi:iron complex transport system ATP-binding protein
MLKTEQIWVALRGRTILRDVSVEVRPGTLVAVIGPNGAGKSTLLRTLSGEIKPVRGEILLAGRPLSQWTVRQRAQRRAVLPQQSALAFPFSALDVVLLGRTPHHAAEPTPFALLTDKIIARAALDLVGLGARLRDSYDTLSGGQQQLVHLARVLAQIWDPPADGVRCLLLDEPTASLDLRYQHLVLSRARKLAREGAAVLAVLHDVNLAAQYADRLVVLNDGEVVEQGTPGRVLRPALLAAVFGVPVTLLGSAEHPVVVPTPLDSANQPVDPTHLEVR